ncbi:MAG: type II toxin-antitoxin system VapC family toxin [Thiomargarita sp.]|nr:type II toxin-antitoxin system VapC family toxin [Thiomargarita sp.]
MVKTYFFDTSALVKRYITEIGSQWVRTLDDLQAGNKIIVARITWVEMLSAFSRLKRESVLDTADFNTVLQAFEYDWDTQYQIVEFDKSLAEQAGELVKRHPLRAYDSVQLASALKIYQIHTQVASELFTFVSADDRLLNIAKLENMQVENPLEH